MPGLPGNPIEEKQMHREKSEVGFPAEGSSYGFMTTFLRTLILLAAATGCLATLSCTLGTPQALDLPDIEKDRKSTRLNSSH